MSPGSGNRQTGTIPKTKVRNNCNVPQEAVTPTRRDINLGNLVTASLDLVPVPEYSVNSTQNRNRRSGLEDDLNHSDFGDVPLVHEGGRFVPVRPQPRTAAPKSSVSHRECPVFSRYRESLTASEQMDDSFGSSNAYFTNQNQRQNNAAAVMIVNPTTANSGNQQHQQNAENYQNANSIIVRNNSIGRTNFPPSRFLNQSRMHTARAIPNNNTVTMGTAASNTSKPKSSNIIHNGFNPSSSQSNISNSSSLDNQEQRVGHSTPHNVEFELGQIRGYIRATSNLVNELRAVENEEIRPASAQSNCSGYSENELFHNELRVKLEKSQQRIHVLQEQQKQLLMCQQEAKNQLAKMNAAFATRQPQEQPCQPNHSISTNGALNDTGTSSQNFQHSETVSREYQPHEMSFSYTPSHLPELTNQQIQDFVQQVNSVQAERYLRNAVQGPQGTSLHQDNYADVCQPFQETLEQLSNKMAALGELINSQASDSGCEEEAPSIGRHNMEMQRKALEPQAITSYNENVFANYKKDQTSCSAPEPSVTNDKKRRSHRSHSSSSSPVIAAGDEPHNYTYTQDQIMQSQSSDEDGRQDNSGMESNIVELTNSQAAQINVMEMKLKKLRGMLSDPNYNSNVQQSNSADGVRTRSVSDDSGHPNNVDSNECNSRDHYEELNQTKHQNYNANVGSHRYDVSSSNKCKNIDEQNMSAHEKLTTGLTAMNELTEQLKRKVRDITDQRMRCAASHPGQYSDYHETQHPTADRKTQQDPEFSDRKRRTHSFIDGGFDHSKEESAEAPKLRQSEVQSQQSQRSLNRSCACQPHGCFSSEQEEDDSMVSLVHRKNNKNTSSSTRCDATREDQPDSSALCNRSSISTPDQYKEGSTYCESAHSLDTSAVLPNASSTSNHTAYRANRSHGKQQQQHHSCSSGLERSHERENGGVSDGSLGSIPGAPPPPMSPIPQRPHRHRWPHYFGHSDNGAAPKESSCSGGETSTSIGLNVSQRHRSGWQQQAEQLQQQLEQTRNLCQTLLQDHHFNQHRPNEQSQTLEAAPAGAACPVPPAYPGTFMMPYGVMVPMSGEMSGPVGPAGSAGMGGAAGGTWWALAGCYNQLNSQQWEISTLRNSLMLLEEKYMSLANLVNLRAHSTPPSMSIRDDCDQAHAMRTRSALSNNNINHWQHHSNAVHPMHRFHSNAASNDMEQHMGSTVLQRNAAQEHAQNVNFNIPVNQSNSWTSHDMRSTAAKATAQLAQQNLVDPSSSIQNYPQNVNAEIQQANATYNLPATTVYNNCAPPSAPNLNILNCLEPQLIQNNTNPNCLLSLTPAQQPGSLSNPVHSSPLAPAAALMDPASAAPQMMAGQNMALNNQVPPGNRANNYWDNFRSYSRQNLLSGSSKINADSSMGTFMTHNPQPLVERSHNTLHSSVNNAAHNTPTNTPKRNINSASANASNLGHQAVTDTARNRGRRNISQEASIFTAPPDVLNVNQNSELATETELNSMILFDESSNRFHTSINVNVNREYEPVQDRNINVANPIPEILVSHTNNFLNMGGIKRKSSSKLPAKNSTGANYSLEHLHHRNIDLTGGAEVPNLNLASASSSSSQDKSTSKLFDLLRENVYSEVTALISANENHPHFLIQLFRDLQQIRSDPLRQRMLASIQEVSHDDPCVDRVESLPGPSRPSMFQGSEREVASAEVKPVAEDTAGVASEHSSGVNPQVVGFISAYKGTLGDDFLLALLHLMRSTLPAEKIPLDFAKKMKARLSTYENEKVNEVAESLLTDISTLLNACNNDIAAEVNSEGVTVQNEKVSQDAVSSMERSFSLNTIDDADNHRRTGDYGEAAASVPSGASALPSRQADRDALRSCGAGAEGAVNMNAHRTAEPKIDLIESAEVCNGDLAEADQSRHSETGIDQSPPAANGDGLSLNTDVLPDVIETEEQTPTEAEAEWLVRVPTRLHNDDGPENQSESGQG